MFYVAIRICQFVPVCLRVNQKEVVILFFGKNAIRGKQRAVREPFIFQTVQL